MELYDIVDKSLYRIPRVDSPPLINPETIDDGFLGGSQSTIISKGEINNGYVAGSDQQIQYNDDGVFAGDANLVWDKTNTKVTITSASFPTQKLILNGSIETQMSINVDNGDNLNLYGGGGIEGNSSGGDNAGLYLTGDRNATSIVDGEGGWIQLVAGDGGSSSGDGGRAVLQGGYVNLPGQTGNGGMCVIQAGAGSNSYNGGNVQIYGGTAGTTATGGTIDIRGGNVISGTGGSIQFVLGSGTVANGKLKVYAKGDLNLFVTLDFDSLATSSKTFTFPNITGTIALITQNADFNTLTVNTNLVPDANDGAGLGISGTAFSDLFLASGATIDFNAGDIVLTHSTDTLTVTGGTFVSANINSSEIKSIVGSTLNITTPSAAIPEDINIEAGASSSGNNTGADLSLSSGDGNGSGNGGEIALYSGNGGGTTGNGGSITFTAGSTTGGVIGKYKFYSIAGAVNGILNFESVATTDKTFTFPNTTGTLALLGLTGTKVYYVADSSGGAVTRKLTFTDGILTAET